MGLKMEVKMSGVERKHVATVEMTDDEVLLTKYDFDKKNTVENHIILETRFGFTIYKSHREGSLLIKDAKSGHLYGDLPSLALNAVWRKANRYLESNKRSSFIDESVWEKARQKFENFVKANDRSGNKKTVLIQDVWEIEEIDFIELGIESANEVIELMRLSVLEDILESRVLDYNWNDIRRFYPHSVKTSMYSGGIFSEESAAILNTNGIKTLNAIRPYNIYALKCMVPEHDFINFPRQINSAYREDRAKRRDFRYRIFPFILGFIMLVLLIAIGYEYKYTLLKNMAATTANIVMLSLWASSVCFIAFSALRAALRRKKKRPEYVYFTKYVKVTSIIFGVLSLFALLSITTFYERYDGYNDTVYYRNVSDNEISIAGLVDESVQDLIIPEFIDGKAVTKIDPFAFYKDNFGSVTIGANLSEISYGAFLKCTDVEYIDFGDSAFSVIKKNAFKNCENLVVLMLPSTVEFIDNNAFKNCTSLTQINRVNNDLSMNVGNMAFKNCFSLNSVGFLDQTTRVGKEAFKSTNLNAARLPNVEQLGKNAFADCGNLTSIELPFIGKDRNSLKNATYLFGRNCEITYITLTDCDVVYKGMFKGMRELVSVSFDKNVEAIEARAFSGCENLEQIDLEGVHTIGNYAFLNCVSLKINELPQTVVAIGKGAFKNCNSIETLNIKGDLVELGKEAFRNMDQCKSVVFNENISIDSISDDLFRGCKALTYTNIIELVSNIGNDAFRGCSTLDNIVLGSNIETLGRRIFKNCDNLKSVTIAFSGSERNNPKPLRYLFGNNNNIQTLHIEEENVVYSNMFNGMKKIVSVTFGQNVDVIEKGAFRGCVDLEYIDLDGVKKIEKNAFRNCTSLRLTTLPSTLVSIGKSAFKNCDKVLSLKFGENIEEIGDKAFMGCSALQEVDLSDSVKLDTISKSMFEDCFDLQTILLSKTINVFENRAFKGCSSLKALDLMQAEKIGRNIFKGCSALESVSVPFLGPNKNNAKGYDYFFKNADVQYLIIGHLNNIPAKAFRRIDSLKSVIIYDDVEVIGKRAFEKCTSLTNLEISGVKVVKSRAFKDCTSLTVLSDFNEVEKIGAKVFSGCDSLIKIELSDKITRIERKMFEDCGFEEIILASNTSVIEKYAFKDCKNLKAIVIPSSVCKIKKGAFKGCSALESIDLSGTELEKIDTRVFENCYALQEVLLPSGVKSIEKRAFKNCSSLVSIDLQYVSEIERSAFEACDALTKAFLTDATTIAKNAFRDCSALIEVTFSSKLKTIGRNAFRNCDALTTLVVPNSVKKIGRKAFADCNNLEELSVPFIGRTRIAVRRFRYIVGTYSDVVILRITDAKKIKRRSFTQCSIKEIHFNDGVKINEKAFERCYSLEKVFLSKNQSRYREYIKEYDVEVILY